MSSESVVIGVGTFFGLVTLIAIAGGILLHKHRQDIRRLQDLQREVEARAAYAAAHDLPPLYNDHVHDPVCIYEHEVQPETAAAQTQPILVHAMSEDQISIPLSEDLSSGTIPPLVSSSSIGQGPETTLPPSDNGEASLSRTSSSTHDVPTASFTPIITNGASYSPSSSTPVTPLHGPSAPSPAFVSTPSVLSLALSTVTVSSTYTQHDLDVELGILPPPPSYDTPNRVVEVSPLPMPASVHIPMSDYFDPQAMTSLSLPWSPRSGGNQLPPSPHYPNRPAPYHHNRARAYSDLANYRPADPTTLWAGPASTVVQRTESSPVSHGGLRLSLSIPRGISRRSGYASPPALWSGSSSSISTLPAPAVTEIRNSHLNRGRARSSTVSGVTTSSSSSSSHSRLWVQQLRQAFALRSSSERPAPSPLTTSSAPASPIGTPGLANATSTTIASQISSGESGNDTVSPSDASASASPSQAALPETEDVIVAIDQQQAPRADEEASQAVIGSQLPESQPQQQPQSQPQPRGEGLDMDESSVRRSYLSSVSDPIASPPPRPTDYSLVSSLTVPATLPLSVA